MEYGSSYNDWKNWDKEKFCQVSEEENRYFSKEIFSRLDNPKRIIEIGFGNGSFLGECRRRNVFVQGVEVNKDLLQRGSDEGFSVCESLEDIPLGDPFDAIVALDVIEHLDPSATIKMLQSSSRLLKKDGKLIARFPNGDSPFGRIHQNGDVTHLQSIGKYKVMYYANQAGLDIDYIGAPADCFDHTGLSRSLTEKIRKSLQLGLEIIFEKAYYYQRVCLATNYLTVMTKR